jgi:hypothetical protein
VTLVAVVEPLAEKSKVCMALSCQEFGETNLDVFSRTLPVWPVNYCLSVWILLQYHGIAMLLILVTRTRKPADR